MHPQLISFVWIFSYFFSVLYLILFHFKIFAEIIKINIIIGINSVAFLFSVRKVNLASHRETVNFAKLAPTLASGRAFQSNSGNSLHRKSVSSTPNTKIASASNRHVEGSQFDKNRVPSVSGKTFGEKSIPAMQNRGFFPQQAATATTNTKEITRKRLPPMSEIFGGASLYKRRPQVIKCNYLSLFLNIDGVDLSSVPWSYQYMYPR